MKESPFGFSYSWEDLRPVHPLFITVLGAQVLGAALGLIAEHFPATFDNLWFGGAIATFPGFLVGLPIQKRIRPESIAENRVMVRRMGLVALILTVGGVTMPLWWHAG